MSYLDWHVGMKVVCVDDHWNDTRSPEVVEKEAIPTNGCVYSIREIGYLHPYRTTTLCVRLNEIENPFKLYSYPNGTVRTERCFGARRFRPVQTRPTDISIFTAMLHDRHDEVPA